jgi:hypothetical protein
LGEREPRFDFDRQPTFGPLGLRSAAWARLSDVTELCKVRAVDDAAELDAERALVERTDVKVRTL